MAYGLTKGRLINLDDLEDPKDFPAFIVLDLSTRKRHKCFDVYGHEVPCGSVASWEHGDAEKHFSHLKDNEEFNRLWKDTGRALKQRFNTIN